MRATPLLVLFSLGFLNQAAEASEFPIITVTAEKTPGEVYTLGFDLDDTSHQPTGIYYADSYNPNGTQHFSLDTLKNNPPVIVHANDPTNSSVVYDVIKIQLNAPNFFIYYKQDARTNNWLSKQFTIACDADYTTCSITDTTSGKVIHSVYLPNHKSNVSSFLPIQVVTGVDSIETN